mmetsp:Transcript_34109/g.61494  ORF Transcript_34109/g.61494 Transcript_34109/m.61494 type:complete len:157 (-) Transcript_34109:164-634(-)|eukprot:CAMPEP_0175042868 /NCGR_PEP_ID=MMETSP0052_2-20121109/2829_1 /TAXON_ID=51329 ORGANISM="Polytomella parva, Strain SAG 63-3" /NCGR_SAMPLE_ID=MMETSP0052_2 /ASSEMBLY_ACC=CAM_ASM_000194 /LENGTH=156 /DNA_ID=CAMNT_0016305781 /DNA_START=39 /DNA_END=509 /DNA_ORIENTATION=-
MNRLCRAASALRVCRSQLSAAVAQQSAPAVASKLVEALRVQTRSYASTDLVLEPVRKYKTGLATRELWHEAWMYEDKVGTAEDPIVVPSLEGQRILGVTDPEDDTIVVWGLVAQEEPPRQLIEGGDYFVCKKVDYIRKVGDVLEEIEAQKAAALPQ